MYIFAKILFTRYKTECKKIEHFDYDKINFLKNHGK